MRSDGLVEHALLSRMKYTVSEARKLLYYMVDPEEIKREDDYHKFLFFEMYPLLYLAEYLPDVKWIRFSGANERHDGEIKFKENPVRQRVEFVRAVDSEKEIVLSQISKLQRTFPGFNLEMESEMLDDKEVFRELKRIKWLWRKAIKRKMDKNSKTGQYNGVWLGVVFDDTRIPAVGRRKLRQRALKLCRKNAKAICGTFRRVFFIGLSGNFIFDSQEAGYTNPTNH